MYRNHEIGRQGEEHAVQYLLKNGYTILDRNFSCKKGELDVIALKKEQIIFIEIKTRTNEDYGLPAEAVTKRKLRHIYKTAEYYLYERNLENESTRIDVIEIYFENQECKINHIKQVI